MDTTLFIVIVILLAVVNPFLGSVLDYIRHRDVTQIYKLQASLAFAEHEGADCEEQLKIANELNRLLTSRLSSVGDISVNVERHGGVDISGGQVQSGKDIVGGDSSIGK